MSGQKVAKGYKQTEVGVIPEDWDVKPLKKISPSLSVGLVINPSSYFDKNGAVPMLVGSHVDEDRINWETANRISEDSNNTLGASRLSAGDLVTVRVGDPGVTAVIPPELDSCNCASMMIVRQHSSFISKWLCYVMNSVIGRSQIEHVQYGTAQKQFNISDAVDFLYPFPTIAEQKQIARALIDIDALIEGLEGAIGKKRQIKQGAMQELLTGKRRLPGFGEGMGYQQTEIGLIPDDWDAKTLETCVSFLDGKRRPVKDADRAKMQGSIPYYGASGIVDYVNDYLFDDELILLGEDGENILSRNSRLAFRISGKTWVNNHAHVLKPNQDVSISFLTDYLESLNYERFNSKLTCSKILVALPPTETEQQAIATILSDMDNAIATLEAKLTKTRQLKQGMMHELLTGRIRLV
jgi:type I restriction enzyme, S subunit